MKYFRIFIFASLFWATSTVFAQQVDNYHQDTTTLYQRAKGFSQDPIRSKWRQEVKLEDSLYVLRLFDKKDVLQELISFVDKELLERKGKYERYKFGKLAEEGNYEKGYKVGEWRRYYSTEAILEKANFTWDKLSGSRKAYYANGKLALDELYANPGVLMEGKYYDESGRKVDLQYVEKAILNF